MFQRLFIIGNGFDLHHDIASSFQSFKNWISVHHTSFYNQLMRLYSATFPRYERFWQNFEDNICKINSNSIISHDYTPLVFSCSEGLAAKEETAFNLPNKLVEMANLSELLISLESYFNDWVLQLNTPNVSKKIKLDTNGAKFLCFNYTSTLEDLYGINREDILYIHGNAR